MRKLCAWMLAAILLLSIMTTALGEEPAKNTLELYGNVAAGETLTITAPYGGRLADFTLKAGDLVAKGDTLFTLETTKVYSPISGTVSGVFALPGDESAFVEGRYGAFLYIEPEARYTIEATTAQAYNENENKIIHIGEEVYLQGSTNKERTGLGRVTMAEGSRFTIEVLEDSLELGERVGIYRDESYDAKSRLGYGITARTSAIAISGAGSVLKVHATSGSQVKRGDLLLETVTGTLPGAAPVSETVEALSVGVITSVDALTGGNVAKDQTLATLAPLSSLEVQASINETDLPGIAVGDTVIIEVEGLPQDENLFEGVVSRISWMSTTTTGDAQYLLYADFEPSADVRIGMSVTLRFE